MPLLACLLQGYFWKGQKPGEGLWLHPLALQRSPGAAATKRKREKSFSFLPPALQSSSRRGRASLAGGCAGRSRSPEEPVSPACLCFLLSQNLPLNICRACSSCPSPCCSDRPSHPSPGRQMHWGFGFFSSSNLLLHPTPQSISIPTSSRRRTQRELQGLQPQPAYSAAIPGFGRHDAPAPI